MSPKSLLIILLVPLVLLDPHQCFGQNATQTVRGSVLDRSTQRPILGATIIVLDSDPLLGSTSEENGKWRLENVPLGRKTIKVSCIGFEDRLIPNIQIGSGKEVIIDIQLIESILNLKEIIVSDLTQSNQAINDMGLISARSFTVEETRRYPATIGDPLRLASCYAGTNATDDGSNEIIIRGNTPRGILWKLEGVEIPSPNHFSSEGTASGGVSMLSTQIMARSDFFTSAFAPEYANATAGVFDIHLRKGNNEKIERTIQAGFLGLDTSIEGPLSKYGSGSYLFNYRYSTLAILSTLGFNIQKDNEDNVFQDLSFKFNIPTKSIGTFSIFGLGGLSRAKQINQSVLDEEDYDMGVVGVLHQVGLTDQTFLKTTFSTSGTRTIDNLIEDGFSNTKTFLKSFQRLSFLVNKKINTMNLLELGATASLLGYKFNGHIIDSLSTPPFNNIKTFDDKGSSSTLQSFGSWRCRINNKLSLVLGLHAFRFNLTKEFSLEPRIAGQWKLNSNQGLSFGYGLHSRIESLEYYFGNFIEPDGSVTNYNRDLGLTKAHHFVIGFHRQIGLKTHFRAETYYQFLFNVPVLNDRNGVAFSSLNFVSGYTQVDLDNAGTGKNYGIELSLERKFSDGYFYMSNLSVYESKYKASDGIQRNTRFNGNFAFNILGGREWHIGESAKNTFGINGKLGFAGNKRFVPIDVFASQQEGREIRINNQAFKERYPDHLRGDIQINFRKNGVRTTSEWRLDVQNFLDRKNVISDYYSNGSIVEKTGLGTLLVLSYRVEF